MRLALFDEDTDSQIKELMVKAMESTEGGEDHCRFDNSSFENPNGKTLSSD